MDAKLFFSTFLLIFLAEMGDKTQLTAMARAAGSDGGKWTVFAAAATALILSTLIAITLGRVIARFVPDHVVRILAAVLFIFFGVLLLISALRQDAKPTHDPAAIQEVPQGMVMRSILRIAAEFEEAAAMDYAALAAQAKDPHIRETLLELEADERLHLQLMKNAGKTHEQTTLEAIQAADLPSDKQLQSDVAVSDRPILAHAIEHEMATMQFYEELALKTPIPALQRTFNLLAEAERAHVERIKALLSKDIA